MVKEIICFRCFRTYNIEYDSCPHCGQPGDLSVSEPQYLKPGTILQNRYQLGIVVGAGGFGTTYAAWDKVLNQKVAIKEFLPGEFSTRMPGQTAITVYGGEKAEQFENGKSRFYEESRKLAKLHEIPGIVHIYNSFEENGTAYIVMEFLEGETLAERLQRDKKVSEQEALSIILPVLQALDAVHKEGILHRDIAPNNIFLTNSEEVKLLDFGAARSVTGTHSKSLTVLYKEGYTPEEQYRSHGNQGTWTDIYACAATLYHMLVGRVPEGALERRRKDTLKEPSRMGVKVSANVDKAVMNALNVEVKYRTKTAGQFLRELVGEEQVKGHFVRTMERKVGRIPIPLIGVGGIATTGVAIFLLLLATGIIHTNIHGFSQFNVPEGMIRVPNLVNCDLETAQKKTENAGLNFMIVDKQFSMEVPENRVLSQDIQPGNIVNSETRINLVMSGGVSTMTESELKEKGITLAQMPDVQYQDRDEMMSLLLDIGLDVEVEYEKTGIVEGKKIIRQSRAAGEKLVEGERVTITVEDFIIDWAGAEPFEEEVRKCLNKRVEDDIWASEMLDIEEIEINDLKYGEKYNIAPIANCLNLLTLNLFSATYNNEKAVISDCSELRNLINMENLYLRGIRAEDADWIGRLRGLKRVSMRSVDVGDINQDKLPQSIESLTIDSKLFETISSMENMNNLKELYLDGCSQANIDLIAKGSALEFLGIIPTAGVTLNLSSLSDMASLKIFCVNNCTNAMMIKEAGKLAQIEELWISGIIQNNSRIVNLNLSDLSDLTNLNVLDLWGVNISGAESLGNMSNLRELVIDECSKIELEDLKEAAQLEKLMINGEDRTEALKRIQN